MPTRVETQFGLLKLDSSSKVNVMVYNNSSDLNPSMRQPRLGTVDTVNLYLCCKHTNCCKNMLEFLFKQMDQTKVKNDQTRTLLIRAITYRIHILIFLFHKKITKTCVICTEKTSAVSYS